MPIVRGFLRVARGAALVALFTLPGVPAIAEESPAAQPPATSPEKPAAKPAAKKKKPPKLSTTQLQKMLEEQQALIAEQERVIAEQTARITEQESKIQQDAAAIEAQKAQLAELQAQLAKMNERLAVLEKEIPVTPGAETLEDRLKRIEAQSEKTPELMEGMVAAGEFPGSMRIPGTDAAIKFGGRVRAAAVFTLDALGSEDRFLTNSIPVEPDDEAAGKGRRTTFSANTSRFNFDLRTPTGVGYMRAFIEGDFFGSTNTETRTNFRLRHAFAEFKGVLVGQTWSTFSDPAADHQDLDFEGINGENVIRQAQFRYTWRAREGFSIAAAAETPEVSLTGGQGVNQMPDLVGRAVWTVKKTGHVQAAVVLRQIRGEWDLNPGNVQSVTAWGASVSGVVPFRYLNLTDRLIYQVNFGKGNARYINDLNSLGGQDAVFNDATGELKALAARGWYIDWEHQWKRWAATREMKLRSSLIWSYVKVENLDFQPDNAYSRTSRLSINLVFSPLERIDVGAEYIHGSRENKDLRRGSSSQFQIVGIFRF